MESLPRLSTGVSDVGMPPGIRVNVGVNGVTSEMF
jgi:hypothetical protein